jgi:hypothetical protein
MLCPCRYRDDIKSILDALDEFTDVSQWHFCLLLLKRLTHIRPISGGKLDSHSGTDVYILDKEKP